MAGMRRLRLGLSLLVFFLQPLFLLNVYAQEEASQTAKSRTQEWADEKTEGSGAPSTEDYRQRLGRVIAVPEEYFPNEIDSYVRYIPSRGASAQSGSVGIIDSGLEYSYQIKVLGKLPVQFGVASEYIGIENTTAVKLPAHLTTASFGVETTLPFFTIDKTYFTVGLVPSFATDNWNFRSSAFRLLQRYFLIHQPDEKWTFICGVAVWPGYKDAVMPILGFIYKPNDRLTFNIIPKRPEISYALTQTLTVFGEADMSGYEYEVSKDGYKNVVLEYNEMHAGAGLRYKPNKHINASVSAGSMFKRSLKYRDESLGKVGIKDGLYTEFRMELYF